MCAFPVFPIMFVVSPVIPVDKITALLCSTPVASIVHSSEYELIVWLCDGLGLVIVETGCIRLPKPWRRLKQQLENELMKTIRLYVYISKMFYALHTEDGVCYWAFSLILFIRITSIYYIMQLMFLNIGIFYFVLLLTYI